MPRLVEEQNHFYTSQHDTILILKWLNPSWAGRTPVVDNGNELTPWITQRWHNTMAGGKTNWIFFLKIMRIVNLSGKLFMLTHLWATVNCSQTILMQIVYLSRKLPCSRQQQDKNESRWRQIVDSIRKLLCDYFSLCRIVFLKGKWSTLFRCGPRFCHFPNFQTVDLQSQWGNVTVFGGSVVLKHQTDGRDKAKRLRLWRYRNSTFQLRPQLSQSYSTYSSHWEVCLTCTRLTEQDTWPGRLSTIQSAAGSTKISPMLGSRA